MNAIHLLDDPGRRLALCVTISLLLLALFFGPIVTLSVIMSVAILQKAHAKTLVAAYLAGGAVLIGISLYHHLVAWLIAPLQMTLDIYRAAGPESIIHFITRADESEFSASLILSGFGCWLRAPHIWLHHLPAGAFIGAVSYVAFRYHRPLGDLKRYKSSSKAFGKVAKQAVTAMNNKPADTVDGSVIGMDGRGRAVTLSDKAANQHTLVLGTTGSGKTVTVCNMVESAINRGVPLIYIDGKGDYDLAGRIARYGQARGRNVAVFAMHGESIAYNPLATGGFTSKKDRIIALREWSEEHYKKLAEGYLQTVFKVMERCAIPCNMTTLSENLDLKRLKALVRSHEASITDAQGLMDELNHQDTASKSIESLVAEIRNFTASEIGGHFHIEPGKPVLTLDDVIQTNGIAYFCLPALEFPSMSQTLGRLVVNDLKATAARQLNGKNPKPVYAVFDEFSVFAGEQVLNVINMGRSAGIHAVLSTQSLSDIASGRKESADHFINQVVGNCNNFILHRQNSAEDAEKLAAMIGTRSTLEYTAQVSDIGPTHMGTVRKTRGFIAHPDDIKSLQTGEAFFFGKEGNRIHRMKARKSAI